MEVPHVFIIMRKFAYITVGTILSDLWNELQGKYPAHKLWSKNKKTKRFPISRVYFYKIEKKLHIQDPRTEEEKKDGEWRRYTKEEADAIKAYIKKKLRID